MEPPTVLITGASRGLGAAAARHLANHNARVVITARSIHDLEKTARQIQDSGGQVLSVAGDVSQPADCARVVAEAVEHFGALHALVNNAGVLQPITTIAQGNPDDWTHNWMVNLLGPLRLTHLALPYLRRTSGRVINVSSGAAINPMRGWGAYCSAKAALNHFTRVLAVEETHITAISFRPGVVDTAMQAVIRQEGRHGMSQEDHARFERDHAEGKLLPPEAPGASLAVLALYAPHDWSGEFIAWDEARLQALVAQHTGE